MSAKALDHWGDDDEEEEDFLPEEYDDDDEGDDFVDHVDEEEGDSEDFPSVLQGEIFMDRMKGLCYEQDGAFCLVCKTSIPAMNFPFEAPVKDSPLVFAGWIHDPNIWMEFEVTFSEESISKDPLQLQLLDSQELKQTCNGKSTSTKTDNDNSDDDWLEQKSPPKGNLKAPPSYSLKERTGIDDSSKFSAKDSKSNSTAGVLTETSEAKMRRQVFSKINSTSDVKEDDSKPTKQNNMVFVVTGSQIGKNARDDSSMTFCGSYRRPSKVSVERLCLNCSIQTFNGTTSASVSGGTTAVAAASTKRNRSRGGDDDSVNGSVGVAYQELIDLHDDTRLSTEELRKRYYGSGDNKGEWGGNHAADNKRLKGTIDRICQKKDKEEDDDEDAYGF